MMVYGDASTLPSGAWNTSGGEIDRIVQALITIGWIQSYPVARQQALDAFTSWANSQGYTEAKYGTRWDDVGIEALLKAALQTATFRNARSRMTQMTPIQTNRQMRGYGFDVRNMTKVGVMKAAAVLEENPILDGYTAPPSMGPPTATGIWSQIKAMPLWQKLGIGAALTFPVTFIGYRLLKK